MLQCPLCSKSLSVGFSLVTHLSIEFHWWSFVYLAILIMFCQTSSFFFSERLRKQQTKFLGTPLLLEDQLWIFLLFNPLRYKREKRGTVQNHKNIYVRGKNDCGRNKGNVRGCSLHLSVHMMPRWNFVPVQVIPVCVHSRFLFFFFFVLTYFVGEFCPKSKKAHHEGSLRSNI